MKKKILFILPWLKTGGLERMQVTIANKLAQRGHEVTVMTLEEGDDLVGALSDKVKFIYKQPPVFKIMSKIPYFWTFYEFSNWVKRASPEALHRYYVGKEKYDVEIGFFRGLSTKIISGGSDAKTIRLAWVHSDFKVCMGIDGGFKNMELVKKAYSKFNKIVCVSDQAKESFEDVIGTDNTVTIHNMLLSDEIRKKAEEKCDVSKSKFTIISVGHLVKAKGFDRLLEAVDRLDEIKSDFDLWIIGEGECREELEKIIKEKGLTNVRLLGFQSNPYKYLAQADLLVCSSLWEGFNLTVGEAIILGVPVLSTKCTGPCEILDNGKYGMLVENSVNGIADGLKEMLTDKTLYEHYKEATAKRTDFFDEEQLTDEIEKLL